MARITRTATITFLATMMIAAALGLPAGLTSTAADAAEPTVVAAEPAVETAEPATPTAEPALTYAPTEGETGTAITVEGASCFLTDGTTAADGVIVVLENDAGEQLAAATVPVGPDGRFAGEFVVPAGVPVGTHHLRGTCVSPELPDLGLYVGGAFTVTGEGPDALTADEAAAQPAAGGIEPYPSYDGQSTCSPSAKPGTLTFSQRTLTAFKNTGTYGISRDCSIGGLSEHKEGRAWDWKADATNSAQHRSVDKMMNWLLASDAKGNRHAMARRLGIMYIIWDRQMFRMYRANDGWQPYTGSHPHTDHVHISLTRAGGNKTTSYWSMRSAPAWAGIGAPKPPAPRPPSRPRAASFHQTRRDVNGRYTPLPGDFDGDGRDDIIWYGSGSRPDLIWWGKSGGGFVARRIAVRGTYVPQVGDFDGDGRDDVIWYGSGSRRDYIWWGSANRRFRSQAVAIGGVYTPPVTGDFDGDGRDDVFWYAKGAARDWIWWGTSDRRFSGGGAAVTGTYSPPFSGDFDGDRRDDIYWYGRGRADDYLWRGRADRDFSRSDRLAAFSLRPLVGNFNGDRRDDVLWFRSGRSQDRIWLGDTGAHFRYQAVRDVRGSYDKAFVVDFDDNGRDDIYWYRSGPGADFIWSF